MKIEGTLGLAAKRNGTLGWRLSMMTLWTGSKELHWTSDEDRRKRRRRL